MRNWNFLLVDDSEMSNSILTNILNKAGYHNIRAASNAFEALGLLGLDENTSGMSNKQPVDIIVTDLFMPGMSGIELCRRIKQSEEHADIPVLMITSSDQIKDLQEAFDAGVSDYIVKPFDSLAILVRIKAALRLKEEMEERIDREKKLKLYNQNLIDDLNIAKQLQMQLLPEHAFFNGISVRGFYMPVAFLGGDLYYWSRLSENKYGVILMDVMGHGTATSMICMYIRSILPELMRKNLDTVGLVRDLNSVIIEFNRQLSQNSYHVTLFYLIVDTREKTVEYVNAGHPPVAFIEYGEPVKWLDKGCIPVGIFDKVDIAAEKVKYKNATHIFMYSDGMYELLKSQSMDIDHLLKYVCSRSKVIRDRMDMIEKLFRRVENVSREDDVSLVQIEIL